MDSFDLGSVRHVCDLTVWRDVGTKVGKNDVHNNSKVVLRCIRGKIDPYTSNSPFNKCLAISGQPVKVLPKRKDTLDRRAGSKSKLGIALARLLNRAAPYASNVIARFEARSRKRQAASEKLEKLKRKAPKRNKVSRGTFPLADLITSYSVLKKQKSERYDAL